MTCIEGYLLYRSNLKDETYQKASGMTRHIHSLQYLIFLEMTSSLNLFLAVHQTLNIAGCESSSISADRM
jgi:hypothetical protein